MNYNIIATGSTGNAVFLDDNKVLIDCGVSYKKLSECTIGIKIMLLTHIHGDHLKISTIKRIMQENRKVLVFCNSEVKEALKELEFQKRIYEVDYTNSFLIYGYRIQPINLYHDVKNFGYRVIKDDFKAIYAVDTSTLEGISAKDYDLFLIEANYDKEVLERNFRIGKLDGLQRLRILDQHLNREESLNFFVKNKKDSSEYVPLHKSSRNY